MEGPDEPIRVESDLGRTLARLVSVVTLLAVLGLLGALGWLFVIYPDSDGPPGHDDEVVLEVREGTTLRRLATELEEAGVLRNARVWSVYMRMRGLDRHLRQGKIRFRIPMTPEEVARAFADGRAKPSDPPDLWRRYLQAVREQAMHLVREGRIVILRKGKPADPSHRIKGVIRLALPGK